MSPDQNDYFMALRAPSKTKKVNNRQPGRRQGRAVSISFVLGLRFAAQGFTKMSTWVGARGSTGRHARHGVWGA